MLFIKSEQRDEDWGSGWRSGSAFEEPAEEEDITSSSCLIKESSFALTAGTFWPFFPTYYIVFVLLWLLL